MPIIPAITGVVGVLNGFISAIQSILPGVKGVTQHIPLAKAEPIAGSFADNFSGLAVNAYGSNTANFLLAEKYRATLINFIASSGLWTSTPDTQNILAILRFQRSDTQGVNQLNHIPPGGENYLKQVFYFHALWILLNVDADSSDEYRLAMDSQIKTTVFYPAVRACNLTPDVLERSEVVPPGTPIVEKIKTLASSPIVWFLVLGIFVTIAVRKKWLTL